MIKRLSYTTALLLILGASLTVTQAQGAWSSWKSIPGATVQQGTGSNKATLSWSWNKSSWGGADSKQYYRCLFIGPGYRTWQERACASSGGHSEEFTGTGEVLFKVFFRKSDNNPCCRVRDSADFPGGTAKTNIVAAPTPPPPPPPPPTDYPVANLGDNDPRNSETYSEGGKTWHGPRFYIDWQNPYANSAWDLFSHTYNRCWLQDPQGRTQEIGKTTISPWGQPIEIWNCGGVSGSRWAGEQFNVSANAKGQYTFRVEQWSRSFFQPDQKVSTRDGVLSFWVDPQTGGCTGDVSPQFTQKSGSLSIGQAGSWSFAGTGCADGSRWINPPRPAASWSDGRPEGEYFTRQVCEIRNADPSAPSARSDVFSSDRFLRFPGGAGTFSAKAPTACSLSASETSRLYSGKHELLVWFEVARAVQEPLGGYRVEKHKSTKPVSIPLEVSGDAQFQVETNNAEGGQILSGDGRILCGLGEQKCSASYPRGTRVALEAKDAPKGWVFDRWSSPDSLEVCGPSCKDDQVGISNAPVELCQTNRTCVVRSGAINNVRASFSKLSLELSATKTGNGSGRITSSPSGIDCGSVCVARFPVRERVLLRAQATAGSYFAGWGGACQGEDVYCNVDMSEARSVTASFLRMDAPLIEGPDVINPRDQEDVTSRQQWRVTLRGDGPVECEIIENYLWVSREGDAPEDPLRRWSGDCSGGLGRDQSFDTPLFWPGYEERDEDDQPLEDPLREAFGRIQSLPDGSYTLVVRQKWLRSDGSEAGDVESEKEFYLDRKEPEPIQIDGSDQEAIPEDTVWEFAWGDDLTQTGPLVLSSGAAGNGEAGVRCAIYPDEGEGAVRLWDWGDCGTGDALGQVELSYPDGTELEDGKYRLEITQRDRIGQTRTTKIPFFRVSVLPSDREEGKDLVRFGARWQNIFVADTRDPQTGESAIGEANHPLRCGKPGTGLLDLCLGADWDGNALDPTVAEPQELWDVSIPMADRAQGFVRLATPGRFETRRGDRRYMHVRLLPQTNPETEAAGGFCQPWSNPYNIASPVADCQPFPVSEASVQLRTSALQGSEEYKNMPRNPNWNTQNTITGNSEIHVCVPGVPRGEDGQEIVDVWDNASGRRVRGDGGNRADLLGPLHDEDCGGYIMTWQWNVPITSGQYTGGDQSICRVGRPRESDFPVPRLPESTDPFSTAQMIGSYDKQTVYSGAGASYIPPYQTSSGIPRWRARGADGDPFFYATAPWVQAVPCPGGGFLSRDAGRWVPADIEAARNGRLRDLVPTPNVYGSTVPREADPGFGDNNFALPPQRFGDISVLDLSNLDGETGNLEEEWLLDFKFFPQETAARWFMDARYYGYHLQQWAYETDVASEKRWIEVFAPRSSR